MSVHKLEKLNKLIRYELAKILLEEGDFEPGTLVTVLKVKTSPDFFNASAIISVLPSQKAEKVLESLNRRIYFLQEILNKRLQMRPVPKIRFEVDFTEAEGEKIERIIRKIQ